MRAMRLASAAVKGKGSRGQRRPMQRKLREQRVRVVKSPRKT